MLVTLCALALLAQDPVARASWERGARAEPAGSERPDAIVVTGTVELSRAGAHRTAVRAAREKLRARLGERLDRMAERRAPGWLPGFLLDRHREEWLRRRDLDRAVRVLDRKTSVRDHGYAKSYQTSLTVRPDASYLREADRWFDSRRLRRLGEDFLMRCGGVTLFWGLLAFLYSWFDRLSRGYMTWRLRLIALGLGVAIPTLVFLF